MTALLASDADARRQQAASAPFSVMRLGGRERLAAAVAATAVLWLAVWWALA